MIRNVANMSFSTIFENFLTKNSEITLCPQLEGEGGMFLVLIWLALALA